MILIKRLKTTLNNFFAYYPAWGYVICTVFAIVAPTYVIIAALPIGLFRKSRPFIAFILAFHCASSFLPKTLDTNACPYVVDGIFHPQKELVMPGFFAQKTFVKGLLKTSNATYNLTLLKKPGDDYLNQNCRVSTLVSSKNGRLQCTVKDYEILNPSLIFSFRHFVSIHLRKLCDHDLFLEASQLLYSLFSGRIENKLLGLQFKEHGLSHILALSGFHLNLILSFCALLFSKVLKVKFAELLGLIVLTIYVTYTGAQSSIIRAYSVCVATFFHRFFSINIKSLHTFALSFIITSFACYDSFLSAGFILSFTATFGLLIFHSGWENFLKIIQPANGLWEKLIYFWMKLFLLQIFIFCITAPTILYFFHSIQTGSIFYNLFYPWFLGVFMFLGAVFLLIKALCFPIGNFLLTILYWACDIFLEGLKKPIAYEGRFFNLENNLALFISSLMLLLFLIFTGRKKKQVL